MLHFSPDSGIAPITRRESAARLPRLVSSLVPDPMRPLRPGGGSGGNLLAGRRVSMALHRNERD